MVMKSLPKDKFRFSEHPWISYLTMSIVLVLAIFIGASIALTIGIPTNAPWRHFIIPTIPHIFVLFVIAPLILKIPNGKVTYPQFLRDIRLSNLQPFIPLVLLGISTSIIMLVSILGTSLLFRIFQGAPFNISFRVNMLRSLQLDLPPRSIAYIVALPAIFEEVGRGIYIELFRRKHSKRATIVITALTFGLFHFLNLLGGGDLVFVTRQVIFGCFVGLFYAIMILRVNSLLPAMIFHYLVNFFMGSFGWYLNNYGSPAEQILLMTLNLVTVIPALILWVRYFSKKWILPMRIMAVQ
jgi:membrane protease YdiL (CAAX protease family)